MKGYPLALAATILLCLVGDHAILAQNPPCDPDRDRRNPALEQAKEAKKNDLRRRGYPERFMKLIDLEQCIECVRIASDAFHIMIVYKDNDYAPTDAKTGRHWTHVSFNWDPESELIAREKTKDGTIKGYYILNTAKRDCKCCPDVDDDRQPQDYSDWDEELQANTGQLIPFDQSNTAGPPPDDLTNPAPQWIGDPVPNIETFHKPARVQVTAPCPQCAGEALKLNDAYRALDGLWDQKISLLNEQSLLENAEATRRNEISLLYYRQRSALTRTADGDKKIEDAERAEAADKATMRQNARDLEEIDGDIAKLTPQIAELLRGLEACVAKCRTTITETAPVATASSVTAAPSVRPAPSVATEPVPKDPEPPVALASACSACDAALAAAQAAWTAAAAADRARAAANSEVAALQKSWAELEDRIRAMKAAGDSASVAFAEVSKEELDHELTDAQAALNAKTNAAAQQRRQFDAAVANLKSCNNACTAKTADLYLPPAVDLFGPNIALNRTSTEPVMPLSPAGYSSPLDYWTNCLPLNNCAPVGEDPFIPGNVAGPGGVLPPNFINLITPQAWATSINVTIEIRVQEKQVDLFDDPLLLIAPNGQPIVREWFNPLGLLARTITQHVDRWRGSMGPRPLLTARDLDTIDRVSNVQAAGLPKGVHVMLTDQGGSTGKTLVMSVLNLSGQPAHFSLKPFAVQPIKVDAQQQVRQAFSRLSKATPTTVNLNAYCVEMLKAPPGPGTLFRVAPQDVQQKHEPMTRILQSAYRVARGNALHPDSNPAAYADSIKQWSLWTVEQKLDETKFTAAFIAHTRKNVEAAGQKWPSEADAALRQAAPNRWRDIVTILKGAGIEPPK